jgi:hypothetical protein
MARPFIFVCLLTGLVTRAKRGKAGFLSRSVALQCARATTQILPSKTITMVQMRGQSLVVNKPLFGLQSIMFFRRLTGVCLPGRWSSGPVGASRVPAFWHRRRIKRKSPARQEKVNRKKPSSRGRHRHVWAKRTRLSNEFGSSIYNISEPTRQLKVARSIGRGKAFKSNSISKSTTKETPIPQYNNRVPKVASEKCGVEGAMRGWE